MLTATCARGIQRQDCDECSSHDESTECCAFLIQERVHDVCEGAGHGFLVSAFGFALNVGDIGVDRFLSSDFLGQLMHQDPRGDQFLVGEYDVEKEWEENKSRDYDGHYHIGCVDNELDVESPSKDKICGIRRDENGRRNVGNCELGEDPGSWTCNVARDPSHISKECCSGENDGIIADEASQQEEEGIQIEEQLVANLAAHGQHLEGQPTNDT
ncbi:hypothetical protein HG530_010991 [Fusarium avenaceum]|nr:hypothetical protein HG530_010991 [Fusarium avenaceum]